MYTVRPQVAYNCVSDMVSWVCLHKATELSLRNNVSVSSNVSVS